MLKHHSSFVRAATILLYAIIACTSTAVAAQAANGGSFFDEFDRIDYKRWYVSNGWVNGNHQGCTWSSDQVRTANGRLQLRLTKAKNPLRDYKCAEIRTYASLGYGLYEARIRTTAGAGLNSAMFTYSGPPLTKVHDELDFEFLGKSPNQVQTNFWVNGSGGKEKNLPVPGGAASAFNNYAIDWSPAGIKWYINGKLVRSETGAKLPVTPGQFFLTLWSGSSGIADWLGKLPPTTKSAVAEVEWVAYSARGSKCLFPQSISCALNLK
jgi:endo-1,3-1,4-beta-glycanase ExoK